MPEMTQLNLLDWTPRFGSDFDGTTFEPKRDGKRLNQQLVKVWKLMQDGCWRTLAQIADETNSPEASVSARLRDCRKPKFGGYTIEREHIAKGLWCYRMVGK